MSSALSTVANDYDCGNAFRDNCLTGFTPKLDPLVVLTDNEVEFTLNVGGVPFAALINTDASTLTFSSLSIVGTTFGFLADDNDPGDVFCVGLGCLLGIYLPGSNYDSYAVSSITVLDNSPVPLPAALPLFGTGLAALGLVGLRRRRRTAAA